MRGKDRSRFNMFRQRVHKQEVNRQLTFLLKLTGVFLIVGMLTMVTLISLSSINKEENGLVAELIKEVDNKADNKNVEVDNTDETKTVSNKLENKTNAIENSPIIDQAHKEFNITIIGDIMMGGIESSYMLPFKHVVEYTSKADYTVCNLATNISNLDDIEAPRSKYVVKKDIINAFNALGVDGVNIATDHMLDFGVKQFDTTLSILKDAKINVIGLAKDIIYAEKDGIRVAFIAINNTIIGSKYTYTEAGINTYDRIKNKALIEEAKRNADTVIVMPHYGKEHTYVITNAMREVARVLIDLGADMVIGSHSLGIHPVEEYKGKQIIYSSGYFIHDTRYEIGKQSAIFNLSINKEGKITKTEIIPIYIKDGKEVKLYKDIDEKDSNDYLKKLFVDRTLNKYVINKEKNKLVISLKDK